MKRKGAKVRSHAGVIRRALGAALVMAAMSACGGIARDDRFAAESFDEYAEPLTDVVIGEPGKPSVAQAEAAAAAQAPLRTDRRRGRRRPDRRRTAASSFGLRILALR
jgi:hypothetical protein